MYLGFFVKVMYYYGIDGEYIQLKLRKRKQTSPLPLQLLAPRSPLLVVVIEMPIVPTQRSTGR